MEKKKQVQIDEELFLNCIKIIVGGVDDEELIKKTSAGLQKKLTAMIERNLYSKYKTAPSEAEKEEARKKYLEKKGYNSNFTW